MNQSKTLYLDSSKRAIISDLSVLGVAAVWGSSYVAMQEVGQYLGVQMFLAVRFLVSLPILFYLFSGQLKKINKKEVGIGCFLGVFLFSILSLETTGVKYTSAANAGFLIAISVVMVPLFEKFIGGVHKPLPVYLCTLLALLGCYFLSRPSSAGLSFVLGDYIILGAAFIRGMQIFYFGHLTANKKVSTANITIVELLFVALMATASSVLFNDGALVSLGNIPTYIWFVIIYLGVIGTAFAFLAQINAAQQTSSTRVALILSTEPVFAAFFAWMIAGETIAAMQLFGGLLIFIAALSGRIFEARNDL